MTVAKSDERGAAMVMFAITLTVLMGMSGFAVDLGMLFAERRQDQSAADAGVLGGGLDLSLGVSAATNKAAEIVRLNLSTDYTDTEWAAAWGACVDPDAFAFTGDVLGTATECISADGLGTFRVVVPDQTVPTAFAGVFGFDSFTASATAEASLTIQGIGGVLPFAVLGSAASGTEICMRSSTSGSAVPPCTGGASGNFGALEVGQWGNPAVGTESLPCQMNKSDQLMVNISVGIDHFIRIWANPPGDVVDDCAKPFGPNTLPTFQGISGGLFEGLISGDIVNGSTFLGRLGRGSQGKVYVSNNSGTHAVDNVPLWTYIRYGQTGLLPASCLRETFEALPHADAEANITTCLLDFDAGTYVELFDVDAYPADGIPDITLSPRFAIVPQFHEVAFPSGNSGNLTIKGYRAVFVQGLYFGCNGSSCPTVVTPGADPTGSTISIPNGSSPLDQVSGFLLPYLSIDDNLIETGVGGNLGAYQIHLSK
jgi:hypothetical protein